jgi:N-glycosidase YbiA
MANATARDMKCSKLYFYYETEQPYGCFSNFSPHGFELDGQQWSTVEHFFQAQKFIGTLHVEAIRLAATPGEAKNLAWDGSYPCRSDWNEVKDAVMRRAVFRKFDTHADLQKVLLSTGEAILVEEAKKDSYWGCGADGKGQNKLGQILMEVRQLLRDRQS